MGKFINNQTVEDQKVLFLIDLQCIDHSRSLSEQVVIDLDVIIFNSRDTLLVILFTLRVDLRNLFDVQGSFLLFGETGAIAFIEVMLNFCKVFENLLEFHGNFVQNTL